MTRILSEELSEKLRSCVTDDGIILTKKLEKSLTYEEQWALVMAYMNKVRRSKMRKDTTGAIVAIKEAVKEADFGRAESLLPSVYLSSDTPVLKMTLGEASERCVEIMAIKDGLETAQARLKLVIDAIGSRFGGELNTLGELYSPREVVELVAGMPE